MKVLTVLILCFLVSVGNLSAQMIPSLTLPQGVGVFVSDVSGRWPNDTAMADSIVSHGCKTVFLKINEGSTLMFPVKRLINLIPVLTDAKLTVYLYGISRGDEGEYELVQSWVNTPGVSGYVMALDPKDYNRIELSALVTRLKGISTQGKFLGVVIPPHPKNHEDFPYSQVTSAVSFVMPWTDLVGTNDGDTKKEVESILTDWESWRADHAPEPQPKVIPLGSFLAGVNTFEAKSIPELMLAVSGKTQAVAFKDLETIVLSPKIGDAVREARSPVIGTDTTIHMAPVVPVQPALTNKTTVATPALQPRVASQKETLEKLKPQEHELPWWVHFLGYVTAVILGAATIGGIAFLAYRMNYLFPRGRGSGRGGLPPPPTP